MEIYAEPWQDDAVAVLGFKWSLGIVSKQLARTVAEGSTIVMKAVNANSKKMLQRAISCAPRGQRFQWLLKVQVGTQSISPLYWAIQSGNLAAAEAIIQDLLVFRADRERYYYGNDALFERHQDIINCLCREAPMLIPTLLDGLMWRSARTEKGLRRVNYYVKHLLVNQEGEPAEFLREICTTKDPKIMVHPVVVTVSDTLWNGLVRNHFLLSRLWFLVSLVVFMLSQAILPKEPALEGIFSVRVAVFFGRSLMYAVTMTRLFLRCMWKSGKDCRKGKVFYIFRCFPMPKYLHNAMALGNLALAVLLMLMCAYEPMYVCLMSDPQDWPTYDCDGIEDVRWTYSALGLLAMAVHWFLMVDLAVFSTGLSAFVLVCAQVLSEIGRFLVALIFLLLTFGSAISVLEHPYFEMRDIPNTVLCLFSITILLYEDDYRRLACIEPALLTAVLLFVLASSILLMNLLIAQLNSSYVYIYQDMVGFARLNRAQKIVEALANFNRQHFSTFINSIGLDQPLEFNQGDVGVAGGLQLTEPASEHVVLKDSILRFGGSCSMELEWPEESKSREDKDQISKVESLAKKVLRKVQLMERVQHGGLEQMLHVTRPHLFNGSWMRDVATHQQLLGQALKYVPGPEVCLRIFNLLHPPKTFPSTQGDECAIMSYYDGGHKQAWSGAEEFHLGPEDEGIAYGRRVELLKAIREQRQQLDIKDEQLEEHKRKFEHFQEELARCLDPDEAKILRSRLAHANAQITEQAEEIDDKRSQVRVLEGQVSVLSSHLKQEAEKNTQLIAEQCALRRQLEAEYALRGEQKSWQDCFEQEQQKAATLQLRLEAQVKEAAQKQLAAETAKQKLQGQVQELQELAKIGQEAMDFKAKAEKLAAELQVAHTMQSRLQGELDAVKQQSGSLQAALDEANRQSAKLSVAEHKAATAEQQVQQLGSRLQIAEKKAAEVPVLERQLQEKQQEMESQDQKWRKLYSSYPLVGQLLFPNQSQQAVVAPQGAEDVPAASKAPAVSQDTVATPAMATLKTEALSKAGTASAEQDASPEPTAEGPSGLKGPELSKEQVLGAALGTLSGTASATLGSLVVSQDEAGASATLKKTALLEAKDSSGTADVRLQAAASAAEAGMNAESTGGVQDLPTVKAKAAGPKARASADEPAAAQAAMPVRPVIPKDSAAGPSAKSEAHLPEQHVKTFSMEDGGTGSVPIEPKAVKAGRKIPETADEAGLNVTSTGGVQEGLHAELWTSGKANQPRKKALPPPPPPPAKEDGGTGSVPSEPKDEVSEEALPDVTMKAGQLRSNEQDCEAARHKAWRATEGCLCIHGWLEQQKPQVFCEGRGLICCINYVIWCLQRTWQKGQKLDARTFGRA
ncbi:Uncharacterized protein SCF082_LOCUS44436 [Durusdinium trenchii]|uniref:Ion transport domain-containing protein n=1 Tax=Durusdinium trenchii TaxID=1381693 RepID=A0ABP0R1W4_9DINO